MKHKGEAKLPEVRDNSSQFGCQPSCDLSDDCVSNHFTLH